MGKLSSAYLVLGGTLAISAAVLAAHVGILPLTSNYSEVDLAAYEFKRPGRLPPSRPTTTKPVPKKAWRSKPALDQPTDTDAYRSPRRGKLTYKQFQEGMK